MLNLIKKKKNCSKLCLLIENTLTTNTINKNLFIELECKTNRDALFYELIFIVKFSMLSLYPSECSL